jgi:hypothetical protein
MIEPAIEAETHGDQEKLWEALAMVAAADDRIGFVIDPTHGARRGGTPCNLPSPSGGKLPFPSRSGTISD